jgi:hypothetical protein
VPLGPTDREYRPSDYEEVLQRWTRSDKIHSLRRLDTTLRVHATCLAPDFVDAFVERYADVFQLPRRRAMALSEAMMETWEESYAFRVAAATTRFKWNDFAEEDSIWRISLVNDMEQQVDPIVIEQRRRPDAVTRDFFPYVQEFYEVYDIKFPRQLSDGTDLIRGDTKRFTLRFAGPLGDAELVWVLR